MVIAWNRHIRKRWPLPGEQVVMGPDRAGSRGIGRCHEPPGLPGITGILPAIVTSGSYLVVKEVNRSLSHEILGIRLPEVLKSPCNNVHTISWIHCEGSVDSFYMNGSSVFNSMGVNTTAVTGDGGIRRNC